MHNDHWLERLLSSRLSVEELCGLRRRHQSGERSAPCAPREGGMRRVSVIVVCMPNDLLFGFLL